MCRSGRDESLWIMCRNGLDDIWWMVRQYMHSISLLCACTLSIIYKHMHVCRNSCWSECVSWKTKPKGWYDMQYHENNSLMSLISFISFRVCLFECLFCYEAWKVGVMCVWSRRCVSRGHARNTWDRQTDPSNCETCACTDFEIVRVYASCFCEKKAETPSVALFKRQCVVRGYLEASMDPFKCTQISRDTHTYTQPLEVSVAKGAAVITLREPQASRLGLQASLLELSLVVLGPSYIQDYVQSL